MYALQIANVAPDAGACQRVVFFNQARELRQQQQGFRAFLLVGGFELRFAVRLRARIRMARCGGRI